MAKEKRPYKKYEFQYRWMRQVTGCPNHPQYHIYGGRGIQCFWPARCYDEFEHWLLTTLGERPTPKHCLARLDKSKDFAPGNLQWMIKKESHRCHTRQNIYATYKRRSQPLAQWSEELGIPYYTLRRRYSQGIPLKEIVKEFK